PKDSTSAPVPVPDFEAALTGDIRGLRIGIPKEYRVDGMPAEVEELWREGAEWLRDAGAEPAEISLPMTKYALPAYYIIAPAEASSHLARYDGVRFGLRVPGYSLDDMYELTRAEGSGAEVRRRVLIGTYVRSAGDVGAGRPVARRFTVGTAGDRPHLRRGHGFAGRRRHRESRRLHPPPELYRRRAVMGTKWLALRRLSVLRDGRFATSSG